MNNSIKVLISATLIAVFLMVLASCKITKGFSDTTDPSSNVTGTELEITEEAIATEEEITSVEEKDTAEAEKNNPPQTSILYGTAYYNSKEGFFSEPCIPNLTLREDGNFVLVENLAAGMGEYRGSYTMEDNRLILSVVSTNFSGFAGSGVSTIVFTVDSQNSMTLQTDLCLSMSGDVFQS